MQKSRELRIMIYEIDGKRHWIDNEKKLTYKEYREFTDCWFELESTDAEPDADQKMKLSIVGFCKDTDSFIVEPRLKSANDHEWYFGVGTDETRVEQLDFISPDELAKYVTPRNKPMDLKKKDFVVELSLEDWLELTNHKRLLDVLMYDEFSEIEFITVLFKAKKPLSIDELAEIVDCPYNVALSHMNKLKSKGQVECYNNPNSNKVYVVLSKEVFEQLTEEFARLDKKFLGRHDNIVYLSGRLFAVVDRKLTTQNGKGMTTKQFERACMYPFEVFGEILTPVLDDIETDLSFATAMNVIGTKIGFANNGLSKMPRHLNRDEREMFKLGFDEMYNTMAQNE